jgi:hypothetical protein
MGKEAEHKACCPSAPAMPLHAAALPTAPRRSPGQCGRRKLSVHACMCANFVGAHVGWVGWGAGARKGRRIAASRRIGQRAPTCSGRAAPGQCAPSRPGRLVTLHMSACTRLYVQRGGVDDGGRPVLQHEEILVLSSRLGALLPFNRTLSLAAGTTAPTCHRPGSL